MFAKRRDGFTVIELLTVIAIIGILMALVFPVVSSSKRKAKQAQCINNMMQIYTAVKQFQLDEHRYPDFIAGPVQWDNNGQIVYDGSGDLIPLDKTNGLVDGEAVSLYPEYVDSINGLRCPLADRNAEDRTYTITDVVVDPLFAYWSGMSARRSSRATQRFSLYAFDSYDSQYPRATTAREVHYSPIWLYADLTQMQPAEIDQFLDDNPDYERQLWWKNPPSDTIVTWCSYHRDIGPNGIEASSKELVLFLDGHVSLMASKQFENWTTSWQVDMPE